MKHTYRKRLVSLALMLATLISSIFLPFGALAADTAVPETLLLLNRDFEDRTAITNGFGATQYADNTIVLEKEDDNTYMHWVADSPTKGHGHFNIDATGFLPETGSLVLRAKVRTTDSSSTNRAAILARPYDYHNGASIIGSDGKPLGYYSGASTILTFTKQAIGSKGALKLVDNSTRHIADEFVTVTYVFSWTDKTDVKIYAYYGDSTTPTATSTLTSKGYDARPAYFRFQVSSGNMLSWDMDDLQLYIAYTTDPAEAINVSFASTNRGTLFNSNAGAYVDPDAYNGSYFFKVNVDKALDVDGTTVYTLDEKPFSDKNGDIWFPVSTLERVVGTVAANAPTKTVSGTLCVNFADIGRALDGYNAFYHSAGLIAISTKDEVFVEGASDEDVIPIMQKFLFDHVDSSLKKVEAFSVGDGQYLDHPYIFADQNKFDELRATYMGTDGTADETLKGYITTVVNSGASVYKSYANDTGGKYTSLKTNVGLSGGQKNIYEMPYLSAQGYDIGGRHGQATTHASNIQRLAFAWQITRDDKYALLAYDYAVAIGGWEHWGPGHFLNCADAAAPYAIAFDWLYDAWVALGLDVAKIEEIIFTHAVIPGYYSRQANTIPEGWMRCISGVLTKSGWGFSGTNNWNAVCSSGMVIASLAIAGKTTSSADVYVDTNVNGTPFEKSQLITAIGSHTGMSTYQDYAEWLINECMYGMAMKGLNQYIPDGSYIESPGYWSYGTNNFFEMVAALTTATKFNTGTAEDFGMLDAWGIDRTCYFALNSQSGDYKMFNFHDSGGGSAGAQDTSWLPFYGNFTGKTDLAELRRIALASGKSGSATLADVLFYEKHEGVFELPALQNWWEGINGYVVRDSWDAGSIFAGILGDTNNLGHGQIDSGSFVYHNGGTVWFCDIGTEAYNCYGFWGSSTRYRYYKMSAEGNNTLFLAGRPSVPYGQALNGFGKIIETGDNAYGAYTVIDNTSAYGGYASYAYRGMLFTNDRRTVVIQDEADFVQPEELYWVGHTEQDIHLSSDGTVAYMSDGKTVIRVTLVDKTGGGARFAVEDCYTFHLEACEGMDELAEYHYQQGTHERNYDRSQYKRLTVKLDGVTKVRLAVVIEEVAVGEICDLGYEWQSILDWNESTPSANGSVSTETVGHFDGATLVGSVSEKKGNLALSLDTVNGTAAYVIGATSQTDASSFIFSARNNLAEYGYLGDRIVTAELDVGTLSLLPDLSRISLVGIGGELIGIPASALSSVGSGSFTRLTFVLDGASDTAYVFIGDSLVASGGFGGSSTENIGISVSAGAGKTSGTVVLDNILIRNFDSAYTALDAALAGGDITAWADRAPLVDSRETPIATVTVCRDLVLADLDTPLITIAGEHYTGITNPDGTAGTQIDIYRWDELEGYLVDGATVTLYASNTFDPIRIEAPITVIRNGHSFLATSDTLIADVKGDTVTYRKGSIAVTWVTANGSVTEIYSSSTYATYKGTDLDSRIIEEKTENGFVYYTLGGWAKGEGRDAVDRSEMIVTSENCVFYQAREKYEGAFVTVRGNQITGYTDPSALLSTAVAGSYERIVLLSDIYHDSSNTSNGWASTVNLYLNGHTLTYYSSVSSDHMNSQARQTAIYGPGKLVNEATAANLFLITGGKTLVKDVAIESQRAITDHRGGTIEFINCDITVTKSGTPAFGVRNRNNAIKTEATLPTVIIDGCRISLPYLTGSTPVFTVACNSVMRVTDTEVAVSSGGVLFRLDNSTVGTDSSYSYENGFSMMKVKIGNLSHNCSTLADTSSNDPSGYKYPEMTEKIGYVEGSLLASADGVVLYDDCLAVRHNDTVNPYIVAKPEDKVTVTWRVGKAFVREYWLKGSIPTPDSEKVSSLISSAPEGQRYSFVTDALTSDITLDAALVSDFPVSVSLSLHTGLTVNVYVKVVTGVTFTSFTVDGKPVTGNEYEIDGESYVKLSVRRDNPATAAAEMLLSIRFNDATTGVTGAVVNTNVSAVSYITSVLAGDYSLEMKQLMGNALNYIKCAYEYDGNRLATEYNSIVSAIEAYPEYVTVGTPNRAPTELGELKTVFVGAALYLEDTLSFRFYISEDYRGTVSVSYKTARDGSTVSVSREASTLPVEQIDGLTYRYLDIPMRAYDLSAQMTLSATKGGVTLTAGYGLACYYHGVATELDETTAFINAILAYTESARKYLENQ